MLAHPLVTCSRPRLVCDPREGVFTERSLGSQLKFSSRLVKMCVLSRKFSTTLVMCRELLWHDFKQLQTRNRNRNSPFPDPHHGTAYIGCVIELSLHWQHWKKNSNSQLAALAHPLVTCSRPRLVCASHEGVFVERSLGSQLEFSAGSACLSPCHTQSTAARLCSTRGSFCGAVLGQSAQILSRQRSPTPLSHAVNRGSPVLHTREDMRRG